MKSLLSVKLCAFLRGDRILKILFLLFSIFYLLFHLFSWTRCSSHSVVLKPCVHLGENLKMS
jgi:hypothetical protein